ncbi:MAG: GreA/GreB family elongation factor [Clostridia bacterium]|nr:GreA/GreB family elongation factor [Clostridia bacterium]
MHNELTRVDIEKLKEELEYRRTLVPGLREEVKRTREYGDLSENDEYKSAKRDYNRNKSRMRYLENMIETAVVIDIASEEGVVGLFDYVEIYYPEDDETREVRIVTTLRNDVLSDCISKESPFGKALLGARVGDTVTVHVNERVSYPVEIRAIKKGEDDASLSITQ